MPGRKLDQSDPPAWATPAHVESGFHVPSHSARRPKSRSAPGWSRVQNLITAEFSDPLPIYPAALHPQKSPAGRPGLLPLPQAQLERRLQRPAGADSHSKNLARKVDVIVARVICCTDFPGQISMIRASRHLQPQTASARSAPFAAANGSNRDPRLPVGTSGCGLVCVIIIAINDSRREWRGSRVKKRKNFQRGDAHYNFRPVGQLSSK